MEGWGEDGLGCVEHWAGEGWWHQAQTLLPGPFFTEEVQSLQISTGLAGESWDEKHLGASGASGPSSQIPQ